MQRVDVDEQPELAARFDVRSVPTLVLIKGTRAVARLEGRANAPEIEELVEQHLGTVRNRARRTTVVSYTTRREEKHAQARSCDLAVGRGQA